MDLDGCLGDDLVVAVLDEDPVRLEGEEVLLPPLGLAQQQLERPVGGLELVALVLEFLDAVDDRLGVLGA